MSRKKLLLDESLRDDIIRDVVQVYKSLPEGTAFTREHYRQAMSFPENQIRELFGSWSSLMEECRIPQTPRGKKPIDKKLGQKKAEAESKSSAPYFPLMGEDSVESIRNEYKVSGEDIILDVRAVQAANPEKHITENFYHNNGGKYSKHVIWNRFGTWQELRSQAGLDLSRGGRAIQRATGLHAARDIYRGFQEQEVNPYVGKYERPEGIPGYKKLIFASDFHAQDTDPWCMDVLVETCKRVKPDIFVFLGDVFDFYDFSHFDHDPRLSDLEAEITFVRDKIFRRIREAVGPDCQIDFIIGNHDFRLLRHLSERSPYLRMFLNILGQSLGSLFGLDKHQINLVSRADLAAHRPAESREEMLKNYKTYFKCFTAMHDVPKGRGFILSGVSGHTHKPDMTFAVDDRVGGKFWMTLPCMAKVDAEYVTGLNQYQQGFGIVHIDTLSGACNGELIVMNDKFTVVGGKVYYR